MLRRLPSSRSQLLVAGILLLGALTLSSPLLAHAQVLSSDQLSQVKANLASGAKQSWEIGTRAQALTESDTPSYSVLNSTSLPPPKGPGPSSLDEVISIARSVLQARNTTNTQGPQPLVIATGEAAGDPASIGVAVLIANWTGAGASDNFDYAGAAQSQLEYLLEDVPRTSDGAISHRVENVQLWSDFVYMVPPFLAYYGVLSANQTLLQAAYDQCRLYRQYLVDEDAGGMWRHIAGNSSDNGHWTTGNGWAAGGMLRVLGTIQNSQYSKSMKSQAKDLVSWVSEIHSGIYPHLQTTGLFKNYADDGSSFDDASGTALITSTVYRLAILAGVHTHLPLAEKTRIALSAPASGSPSSSSGSSTAPASTSTASTSTASTSTASTLEHFTSDMWLQPVVNPYNIGQQGDHSPEGEAFVVEMYAAWRDWAALGSPGVNAATPTTEARACASALLMSLGIVFALLHT